MSRKSLASKKLMRQHPIIPPIKEHTEPVAMLIHSPIKKKFLLTERTNTNKCKLNRSKKYLISNVGSEKFSFSDKSKWLTKWSSSYDFKDTNQRSTSHPALIYRKGRSSGKFWASCVGLQVTSRGNNGQMNGIMIIKQWGHKQDQKDLLNLPLYRAMYFYIVMCSLWRARSN